VPPDAQDLADELNFRRFTTQTVLDAFEGRTSGYADWRSTTDRIDALLWNEWSVVWPDKVETFGEPHVPNVPRIAVEDRARLVGAGNPSIVCRPETVAAKAKQAAERRERFIGGYWEMSHVRRQIVQWASDLMTTGVGVCRVLPDFSLPKAERFPLYKAIDPRHCFPGPLYTPGPYPDDMLVSYREPWRTVAHRYGMQKELSELLGADATEARGEVQVIEYYDDDILCVVARYTRRYANKPNHIWLVEPMDHGLDFIPVSMGVRPNPLRMYDGDFSSILGAIRTWNRHVAMATDSAIDKVYPSFAHFDVANPQDRGPDADLELESPNARAEFVSPPGEPYSNIQLVKQMADSVRAGSLLPPARTGDPNESIISAAGISAANSQMADHVRSLQRDCISPMLEAANAIALNVDEKLCDAPKAIHGYARGRAYREQYTPSEDIAGNYRNSVSYGMGAGLDEVNTNVLVLQQMGAGLISQRSGREQSPFVANPQDEEKIIAMERLHDALYAGLIAQAAQGTLPAQTVADIMAELEKPNTTLHDAVARNVIAAPMAQPPQQQVPAAASGNAGAEQPTNFQGPPLEELMVGGRR